MRTSRWGLGSCLVVLVSLTLSGCGGGANVLDDPFVELATDDGRYLVQIEVGEAFGFGSQDVTVWVHDLEDDSTTVEHTFELHNDGARVGARNLTVTVADEQAFVCARGQEQADTRYSYRLDGSADPERRSGC